MGSMRKPTVREPSSTRSIATPAREAPVREETEYLHVKLPVSTKRYLERLNYDTRVSITQILVRVLAAAKKTGVSEHWIKEGGPVPTPPEQETTAQL
jgi:hypothetical protein